jgi:hypothetical protein
MGNYSTIILNNDTVYTLKNGHVFHKHVEYQKRYGDPYDKIDVDEKVDLAPNQNKEISASCSGGTGGIIGWSRVKFTGVLMSGDKIVHTIDVLLQFPNRDDGKLVVNLSKYTK